MNDRSCAIIIPVHNAQALTRGCLESIVRHTHSPYSVIIIDNASDAETAAALEQFRSSRPDVTVIRNRENAGWVKAVNQGIAASGKHPYLCIMNNDTVVRTDGWLERLIEVAESAPDIGLVNPLFETKTPTVGAWPFVEIDFCRGYCILMKRRVVDAVGGLDEAYGLGYYDDDDLSMRAITAGFRCVRANAVLVEHLRDSTFKTLFDEEKRRALHRKNKELFYRRWGRRLTIVFILTKGGGAACADTLLRLARRQHIVHVWHAAPVEPVAHINIRPRPVHRLAGIPACASLLAMNAVKREAKRYDLVFCDHARLAAMLSLVRRDIVTVAMDRDAAVVLAEAAARSGGSR